MVFIYLASLDRGHDGDDLVDELVGPEKLSGPSAVCQ